jgi:hypothetical protein
VESACGEGLGAGGERRVNQILKIKMQKCLIFLKTVDIKPKNCMISN